MQGLHTLTFYGITTEVERSVTVISFVWVIDFEDNTKATVKLNYACSSHFYANFDISGYISYIWI